LIREVVGAACDAGSTCAQIFGQKFSTPEFVITGFETAFKAADRESRTAGPDEGVKVQTSAHALHALRPTPGAPDMDAPAGLIPFADRLHAHAGLVVSFSFCSDLREAPPSLRRRIL